MQDKDIDETQEGLRRAESCPLIFEEATTEANIGKIFLDESKDIHQLLHGVHC